MKEPKRQKSKDTATKTFNVRCRPTELEFFRQEAMKRGMKISSLARSSIYRVINLESRN